MSEPVLVHVDLQGEPMRHGGDYRVSPIPLPSVSVTPE